MAALVRRVTLPLVRALKVCRCKALAALNFKSLTCRLSPQSEASPVTLSRSLATGIVLGVCPVFGLPLLLSGVAVVRFKLNAPLVAAVQLAVGAGTRRLHTRDSQHSLIRVTPLSPVAFPLVIMFAQAGAALLRTTSDASAGKLAAALRDGPISAARTLSTVFAHALLAWTLVAPLLFLACQRAAMLALFRSRRAAAGRRGKGGGMGRVALESPGRASERIASARRRSLQSATQTTP